MKFLISRKHPLFSTRIKEKRICIIEARSLEELALKLETSVEEFVFAIHPNENTMHYMAWESSQLGHLLTIEELPDEIDSLNQLAEILRQVTFE